MSGSKYDFYTISRLPFEALNDPVLKAIIKVSCGAHVQAHDRAAGAPDERQVRPNHCIATRGRRSLERQGAPLPRPASKAGRPRTNGRKPACFSAGKKMLALGHSQGDEGRLSYRRP